MESGDEGGSVKLTVDDYRAMAKEIQKKQNCTYRQACLQVKQRHPEAREAFKGETLPL